MTQIAVIINEDGSFSHLLSDSEIHLKILTKGKDDDEIDTQEQCLEEVETD